MTDEIRVDGKVEKEKWKELQEYIDENKESRRHSKQFYLEKITEMALTLKREREEKERDAYQNYQELREQIKKDMDV